MFINLWWQGLLYQAFQRLLWVTQLWLLFCGPPTLTLGESNSTDSLQPQRADSFPTPSPVHTPQNSIRPPLSPTLPPLLPDRQLTSSEELREEFRNNIVVIFEESTGWKSKLAKACSTLNLDEVYGEGNVGEIFRLGVVDGEKTFLPEPKPDQFPIYLMKAKPVPASQATVASTLPDSDGSGLPQPPNSTTGIPSEKKGPETSPPTPSAVATPPQISETPQPTPPAVETRSQKPAPPGPAVDTPPQNTPQSSVKKPQESIYDDGSYWKTLELEGF